VKALRVVFRLGLLIGFGLAMPRIAAAAQTTAPKEAQPSAPGLRKLTGDLEKRADQLDEQIDKALKADRWDEAIACARELLALRTRIQGPKQFETVNSEWRLKTLRRVAPMPHEDRVAYQSSNTIDEQWEPLVEKGKYAQAQTLIEKGLEIRRRLLTDDHPDTADSYNIVAYTLWKQRKFAQAQPLFEKALDIRRRLLTDDHPKTATSYNNVAGNLKQQGKYALAQPLYEKALEIRRRLLTDDHPETAESYNNVANNLDRQGKYALAQPLYEKALEIRRRLLTDDHPETANSYNSLAYNSWSQGKYAEAEPLFRKALEIQRRLLTDDHPDTARSYNDVAASLSLQGKYADAQPLFDKALEIKRRLLGDEHPGTAISYGNVAQILYAQGKYAQAQPLYEKALEITRRLLTEDHRDTANIYSNLACNLRAQGKYALARDRWLSAVKSLDAARLRVAFTGLERAATRESARLALATILARLGQPAEAWQRLEEYLGRGLLDELAARQDRRLAPEERARLRELTTELERLDKLVEANPGNLDQAERAKRFADLKRQRDLASIALGEFQTKLVQVHGTLAGQVATLNEIQAALPADAALVAWVEDEKRWGVVLRSRGIPAWVPLAGTGPDGLWTNDDAGLAGRVRSALRSRPRDGPADLRSLVERLRAQRIEPLAKALGATDLGLPSARRLIVLPSRAMAGIPVEVLLAQGDTRTVSYAPSATVFKYLRAQPRPDRHAGLLALGDPVYEEQVLVAARSGNGKFAALPGTRYEVEALAQLFQSDDRPARALLGADASEPELDRLAAAGELGRFGFIHLATHGVIDEAIPQRSAVILTQTGLPDPLAQALKKKPVFDGRLSVREIQRSWDLKAELVTLSACETALGRAAGGEGFVGFTQALLMSGARSVCLSLWKVDDKATSLLMTRFYQNLLGKRPALRAPLPKAEALREAKEWLRSLTVDQIDGELAALSRGDVRPLAKVNATTSPGASPSAKSSGVRRYDHPYYWAAFVLVGDPD